jgi:hypothetical protein
VDLGTVNANTLTGLSLDIPNGDPASSLISMNWGDGSPFVAQSTSFTHVYAPGIYNADLLIWDAGAIHSYLMQIGVSGSPGAMITLNPTAFTPIPQDNPGLSSAAAIPEVPEPSAGVLLMSGAMVTMSRRPMRRTKIG